MALAGVLGLLVGCGSVKSSPIDAQTPPPTADAAVPDAGGSTSAGPSKREIVSGSGSVTGGGMRMDVQIGHPINQGATSGGGSTLEGGAAVKP